MIKDNVRQRHRYHRRVPVEPFPSFGACPPEDRLLPSDPTVRAVARELHAHSGPLPIISPHGHVDAAVFAEDRPFDDPAVELITSDHYVLRMLHSAGVAAAEVETYGTLVSAVAVPPLDSVEFLINTTSA